jgi:biotin carboxyl carrier protein
MKMQNPLAAEAPGKVTRLLVKAGDAVASGALLAEIE